MATTRNGAQIDAHHENVEPPPRGISGHVVCLYIVYTESQMKTRLTKKGNSLALRVPKPIARQLSCVTEITLDLDVKGSGAVHMRKPSPRSNLEEFVSRITHENQHARPTGVKRQERAS